MKRMLALSIAAAVPLLVSAQLKPLDSLSDAELSTYTHDFIFGTPVTSYDTVLGDRVAYSGIFIQLFRAPRPLNLINPWAPRAYGPSGQNLAIDPVTQKAAGWKFFAIRF
jgi:hypothetical protein